MRFGVAYQRAKPIMDQGFESVFNIVSQLIRKADQERIMQAVTQEETRVPVTGNVPLNLPPELQSGRSVMTAPVYGDQVNRTTRQRRFDEMPIEDITELLTQESGLGARYLAAMHQAEQLKAPPTPKIDPNRHQKLGEGETLWDAISGRMVAENPKAPAAAKRNIQQVGDTLVEILADGSVKPLFTNPRSNEDGYEYRMVNGALYRIPKRGGAPEEQIPADKRRRVLEEMNILNMSYDRDGLDEATYQAQLQVLTQELAALTPKSAGGPQQQSILDRILGTAPAQQNQTIDVSKTPPPAVHDASGGEEYEYVPGQGVVQKRR